MCRVCAAIAAAATKARPVRATRIRFTLNLPPDNGWPRLYSSLAVPVIDFGHPRGARRRGLVAAIPAARIVFLKIRIALDPDLEEGHEALDLVLSPTAKVGRRLERVFGWPCGEKVTSTRDSDGLVA